MEWKRWADERPTDTEKGYRWRVSRRLILGMELQPEWTDKLHFCGMGHGEGEWWPGCSDWDGYRRTVDATLEWREALPDETETTWNGLDLLPSPFTGMPPTVIGHGRWITAPPYKPEWLGITSYLVNSTGWRDAREMQNAWNRRAAKVS